MLFGLLVLAGCGHVRWEVYVINESPEALWVVMQWPSFACDPAPDCLGYSIRPDSQALLGGQESPTGRALVYRARDCTLIGESAVESLNFLVVTASPDETVAFEFRPAFEAVPEDQRDSPWYEEQPC